MDITRGSLRLAVQYQYLLGLLLSKVSPLRDEDEDEDRDGDGDGYGEVAGDMCMTA